MKQKIEDKGQRGEAIIKLEEGSSKRGAGREQRTSSGGKSQGSMESRPTIQRGTSYEEAEAVTRREAAAAASGRINQLFAEMVADVQVIEQKMVGFCNKALQLGFFFQEATGRDELQLGLFNAIPNLPERLSFKFAKECVRLVNAHGPEHQFGTVAEVLPNLQLLFQGMNVLEAPRRDAPGKPLLANWGSWIPQTFASVNQDLVKLTSAEPVEAWSWERREMFLAQTQLVHDLHERVKGLGES